MLENSFSYFSWVFYQVPHGRPVLSSCLSDLYPSFKPISDAVTFLSYFLIIPTIWTLSSLNLCMLSLPLDKNIYFYFSYSHQVEKISTAFSQGKIRNGEWKFHFWLSSSIYPLQGRNAWSDWGIWVEWGMFSPGYQRFLLSIHLPREGTCCWMYSELTWLHPHFRGYTADLNFKLNSRNKMEATV